MTLVKYRRPSTVPSLPAFTNLFDSFFDTDLPSFANESSWLPAVNVSETEGKIVFETDVPGIDPKDLEVSLKHDVLTLKGVKNETKLEDGETMHRAERSFGSFTRSFKLSSPIDAENVTSDYTNGVLTITLPKTEASRGRTIPVNVN